jgi:hypothetical protein
MEVCESLFALLLPSQAVEVALVVVAVSCESLELGSFLPATLS